MGVPGRDVGDVGKGDRKDQGAREGQGEGWWPIPASRNLGAVKLLTTSTLVRACRGSVHVASIRINAILPQPDRSADVLDLNALDEVLLECGADHGSIVLHPARVDDAKALRPILHTASTDGAVSDRSVSAGIDRWISAPAIAVRFCLDRSYDRASRPVSFEDRWLTVVRTSQNYIRWGSAMTIGILHQTSLHLAFRIRPIEHGGEDISTAQSKMNISGETCVSPPRCWASCAA